MDQNKISIKGKSCQFYEPERGVFPKVIGREKEMTGILAAWLSINGSPPSAPLLIGPAGMGKTQLVWESATKICKLDLYCMQASEEVTDIDLVCNMMPNGKNFDITLSKLSTAMIRGGVFFIDSIGKMRKKALAKFESVLDHRRFLDASFPLGINIHAHPNFRFIAATNPEDLKGGQLEPWMKQRMTPVIWFDYPARHKIEKIIRKNLPSLSTNRQKIMDCFWEHWREINGTNPPSIRTCLNVFQYAQRLANYDSMDYSHPFSLEYHGDAKTIKEKHIAKAVRGHS